MTLPPTDTLPGLLQVRNHLITILLLLGGAACGGFLFVLRRQRSRARKKAGH